MFKGLNIIEFSERFPDENACYKYLAEIKWSKDYICKKCDHTNYCKGPKPYSRKCTRCKYIESVTAGTAFHKLKFSIKKAFYIAFMVSTGKKGIASTELSRKLSLRQKTCWLFKRKMMQVMKSSEKYPLTGQVNVDEFMVGGPEQGKQGRSKGKRRQVVVALEIKGQSILRAYARVIENAGTKQLKPFFNAHINNEAEIRTDKWRGYKPLQEKYTKLIQEESNNGKNFKLIHRYIMCFKGWMRGIHHRCKHLQAYLDEYNYRFNRRATFEYIFDNLINRMMLGMPVTYNDLKFSGA